MGAHGDAVQTAVVAVLAVVGAVVDGAFDALVRGTGAAAVGAILVHTIHPPARNELALAEA